jgi:aerobic carbon-monoxide dehydrogenase medium subunit
MKKFDYSKPQTLQEALHLLNQQGQKAKLVAGGTDVMVMIKKGEMSPEVLLSLRGIPGLDQIQYEKGALRIGPMTTHRAVERSELIRREFSALADAVDVLGSVQIRNVATVAGNICTAAPSADTAPPLLVLGARVNVLSLKGERTIPLDEFFNGPGETVLQKGDIVTEVCIPKPLPHTGSAYWKHRRRGALDLPMLGVSVLLSLNTNIISCGDMMQRYSPVTSIFKALEKDELTCKEVRIALGVAAPTPMRAQKAETLLRGRKITEALMDQVAETAAAEAQPRDSIRGEAWYRRDMIKVFVKRMTVACIARIAQTRKEGLA